MKKKKILKKTIKILRKEYELHSLYLLGFKKENLSQNIYFKSGISNSSNYYTFSLFIVLQQTTTLTQKKIQKSLWKQTKESCKVYPIIYTPSQFFDEIDTGSNFLCHILQDLKPLYQQNNFITKLNYKPFHYFQCWESKKQEWEVRLKRANFLFGRAEEYDDFPLDSVSKISLLHDCIQQICLGLLIILWEFRPVACELDYLLHYCSYSVNMVKIYENNSSKLHAYHLLIRGHHTFKVNTGIQIQEKEANEVVFLCQHFLQQAQAVVKVELGTYYQKCLNDEKERAH